MLLLGTAIVSRSQHDVLWKGSIIPLLMCQLNLMSDQEIFDLKNVDEVHKMSAQIIVTMSQHEGRVVFEDQ
jgi:hypothetical protein